MVLGQRAVRAQHRGELAWKRSNDTHESTTDPEARLYRKSANVAAVLCTPGI